MEYLLQSLQEHNKGATIQTSGGGLEDFLVVKNLFNVKWNSKYLFMRTIQWKYFFKLYFWTIYLFKPLQSGKPQTQRQFVALYIYM